MNNYHNLDLDVVLKQVAELAQIEEAKNEIINEEVIFNPLVIRNRLVDTKAALDLLKKDINVSFAGISSINEILERADKGIVLSGIELKDALVFHNHCERIRKQFQTFPDDCSLRDYSDSIALNKEVFNKIADCVDNSGEIKADASPLLKQLYNDYDRAEKDLYNKAHTFIDKHQSSLQEPSVFLRNDRVTFLIKNSDKNKYQGYTYGTSASGLAFYVEPASFIEANNKRLALRQQIEDEIEKILRDLSYCLASVSENYYHNFESLLSLCVIFAKAAYGFKNGGIVATFSGEDFFEFQSLCHPLIAPEKVVSNDYRLFAPYQGIVISGSNTGGKTVSLKAIGLSILMTYLGIPLIAQKAVIPFYHAIFIDIDDNQSIFDSLSTFSAHISNINSILHQADEHSLILIDELISGTDPKEAQAISLAILDKIKQIGSKFIITTHFDKIKNYSYDDEKILLSAVGFNMDTLSPTYRYQENAIGASNALMIASRYFDDQDIIENAQTYLQQDRSEADELMDKLSQALNEADQEKEELQARNKEYEKLISDYQEKIAAFDKEKQELKQKYEKELNEYVDNIRQEALAKLEQIKEAEDEKIVEEIKEMAVQEIVAEEEEPVSFAVGDNVRIRDNEQIGIINEIHGNQAIISVRGLTIKARLSDLTLMPKTLKSRTEVITRKYQRVPAEINLVGERVEDALPKMEEYLDRANAAHMSTVKVIHGIGTGRLRTALRERMKKLSYVKSFKDGDYYDGGSAVTMVEFK